MTTTQTDSARSAALDAYIAQRVAQGFRVESRSGTQAVIVSRHRWFFALRWFPRVAAEARLVVSVNEHGEIATLRPNLIAGEPRRT